MVNLESQRDSYQPVLIASRLLVWLQIQKHAAAWVERPGSNADNASMMLFICDY